MRRIVIALCAFAACGVWTRAFAQTTESAAGQLEITLVRGDLYRVREGPRYTVFVVTPEGIILGDPLSQATAVWLRGELEARFPGRPVRFVLQSHHHVERSEGALVFDDTAERIGQREFRSALSASVATMGDQYRLVRNVESTYDVRRTITLGGKTVEMVASGWVHSPDMSVLYIPDERVLFAVDPPSVSTSTPFLFGANRPQDVFRWIAAIRDLPFETLLVGNGDTVTRAEFVALSDYLEAIRTGVALGYEQGVPLRRLQEASFLDAYRDNPHYAARATQIEAVYRTVRLTRAEVSGSVAAAYDPHNSSGFCSGTWPNCSAGGTVPAGTAAVAVVFGASYGVIFEATLGAQSWNSRTRPAYGEEVALRKSRGAVLFRYRPAGPALSWMALLGGLSRTIGDARGMNHVTGLLVPAGGYHPIAERSSRMGITFGVDLYRNVGRRLRVVVPIRATHFMDGRPQYWPAARDVQVGIGMTTQIFRSVN